MLIHLHIPKTGGTSVRHLLAANYGDGFYGLRPQVAGDRLWERPQTDRERITCLSGHVVYGVHRQFTQPAQYVVFLRDPVERLLSLYHYLWIRNGHRRPPEEQGTTMEQFVCDTRWACNDNDQVRFLAGAPYRGDDDRSGDPMDEAAYTAALANLSACLFVGVTEHLSVDIARLGERLGWATRELGWSLRSDQRPRRADLAPSLVRRIEDAQQYDMALYQAALKWRGQPDGQTR